MEEVTISQEAQEEIINLAKCRTQLAEHQQKYQLAQPYPHIVIDQFLEEWAAQKALAEFPRVEDKGWIHYLHINEKKHGLNKMDLLPSFLQTVIKALNHPDFVQYISELTGIEGLLADEMLEGGGLHQSSRGGFLNVHADFTVHPHKRNWRRRVNLLVYLNENWQEDYLGHLELWARDMSSCQQRIAPFFNRCVIFNTDEDSYHGLPDPIQCPEDQTRKSIALYYFTKEEALPTKRATNYRARPNDGWKSILIYADKQLIALYNQLKGWLGINDDFVSKILHWFDRKKP